MDRSHLFPLKFREIFPYKYLQRNRLRPTWQLRYSHSLLECGLRKVSACALGRISDAYKVLAEISYTQGG